MKINPYSPGAGLRPPYLAGREKEVDAAIREMYALKQTAPCQSLVFSGLRGVGKTVLLNELEQRAFEQAILIEHIEIEEKTNFVQQITTSSRTLIRKLSTKAKVESLISDTLEALKTLTVSFNPDQKTFSLSVKERELYLSEDFTQSLTEVFVTLGQVAKKADQSICFFIDEVQFMNAGDLSALICALHRCNQLNLPIMVIAAGLPKVYKLLGDAKSYSERLFLYKSIDKLTSEEARKAIMNPAEKQSIIFEDDAVNEIMDITGNYPYFIQQLCKIVWDKIDSEIITQAMVKDVLSDYYQLLDEGFFKIRYERCTAREKDFILGMVECGELPCTIANVAKQMHTSVNKISPIRAQLLSKGIIYSVRYSELDFTVPGFDDFIKRMLLAQN